MIIPTVSLPHYPARPCRPQGGFGLVLMMRMLTIKAARIMIVRMHRLLSSFLRVLGVSPKAEVRWDVEKNRGAAT